MCNPGQLSDRTRIESLSEGGKFAAHRWNNFSKKINEKIENKLKYTTDLSSSPIIETIQYVRAKGFPPTDLMDKNSNYRIFLWSDLLQNSSLENHFISQEKNTDINNIVKDIQRRKPLVANNIKFYIYQFVSDKYSNYQNKFHNKWWKVYFSYVGIDVHRWQKI